MAKLCLVVLLSVLLSGEGENNSSNIPPAFPSESTFSTRKESIPGRYSETFPTGKPQYPSVKPFSASREKPGSAEWLLRRMAETDSPELRTRAAEAWPISETDAKGIREIIQDLTDPSSKVQAGARQRLSEQAPPLIFSYVMRTMVGGGITKVKSLDGALPCLGDAIGSLMLETLRTELETPQHRRIAAYCLGRMGMHTAAEDLAGHLWAEDAALARTCLDALAALLPPGSAPHWIPLIDHPDPYFKVQAVRALAALGGPDTFDILKQIALGQSHAELSKEVVNSIQGYPPQILFPLLVEIMERNTALRATALRVLRRRTQLDLGPRPGPWREWLNRAAAPPPAPLVPSP